MDRPGSGSNVLELKQRKLLDGSRLRFVITPAGGMIAAIFKDDGSRALRVINNKLQMVEEIYIHGPGTSGGRNMFRERQMIGYCAEPARLWKSGSVNVQFPRSRVRNEPPRLGQG